MKLAKCTAPWLIAVLAWVLVQTGRLQAQAPTPTSLLLRWQANVEDIAGSYLFYSCEYLVYRDGLTIEKCLFKYQPEGPFQSATFRRGTAEQDELDTLRKALTQNHVGLARAEGCYAPAPLPHTATWAPVLTWFGKPPRQNRLVFNDPFSSEQCAPEVLALVEAVVTFVYDVELTDMATTLP